MAIHTVAKLEMRRAVGLKRGQPQAVGHVDYCCALILLYIYMLRNNCLYLVATGILAIRNDSYGRLS